MPARVRPDSIVLSDVISKLKEATSILEGDAVDSGRKGFGFAPVAPDDLGEVDGFISQIELLSSICDEDDRSNIEEILDKIVKIRVDNPNSIKVFYEKQEYFKELEMKIDVELLEDFLHAVDVRDIETVRQFLDSEFNVNTQHPDTGWTGLHEAAVGGDYRMVEILEERKDLRYLVFDSDGHRPSDLAFRVPRGKALELANRLLEREKQEADQVGIDLRPK